METCKAIDFLNTTDAGIRALLSKYPSYNESDPSEAIIDMMADIRRLVNTSLKVRFIPLVNRALNKSDADPNFNVGALEAVTAENSRKQLIDQMEKALNVLKEGK